MNIRRLDLEGAYNVRDLGGYSVSSNGITKWGVFLRSDDLAEITKNDMDLLSKYGINTIINLKAVDETINPIENDTRFRHIHIPLFDDYNKMVDIIKDYNDSFYLAAIKAFTPHIRDIFNSIAKHINDGGILFHCLAGKDRTGIIAMLLLLLAGVSEFDILADYIVSAIYNRPLVAKQNKPFETIHIYPDEIEMVMTEIRNNYNGVENYLKNIDVSSEDIEKIKENFISKL
ncbi:MAG: tyrosine-protein phosphatase [Oscillospiraceae bacterium]|nr:tyrosine-protein phosphatase [Oscillospiraceae bacterium]